MPLHDTLDRDQGFLSLLARRWRLMGATLALSLAGGFALLGSSPPIYEASSKLLLMRADQRLGGLELVRDAMPELNHLSNPLFTQIELMRTREVFAEVIRQLNLTDHEGRPASPDHLARRVVVEPIPKTDLIRVSYRDRDPRKARQVVAAICSVYLKRVHDQRIAGVKDGLRLVDEQLETARKQLATAEEKLLAYKRRIGSVALANEVQASLGEVSSLDSSIRSMQVNLAGARARKASLEAQLGMTSRQALVAIAVATNPRIRALQEQLTAAESSAASQGLSEDHPQMVDLRARIALLRRTLDDEVRRLAGDQAVRPVTDEVRMGLIRELATVESEINTLQASIAAAQGRRARTVSGMSGVPKEELELSRLSRNVAVASDLYQRLLQSREEARLNLGIAPANAQVVEPARVPTRPVGPLDGKAVPVLMFGSLAAAIGLGALRDRFDRRVRPRDLVPNIPIHVGIPLLTAAERRSGDLVASHRSSPHYLEALRSLGMALEIHLPREGRVVGVTSLLAGEGKTTTAANLAMILAESGHRVLLVDCDMVRPRLKALFKANAKDPGLLEVLRDEISPDAAILPRGDLDLVVAGTRPVRNRLALLKRKLGPALETWRQNYDFVVLDLPPLDVMTEVAQVGQHTDGLLLLANLQKVAPDHLMSAIRQLQILRAPVLGLLTLSPMLGRAKGSYYLLAGEETRG